MGKSLLFLLMLPLAIMAQPEAPNLISTSIINDEVWIDWYLDTPITATGYNIYRKVNVDDPWGLLTTIEDSLESTYVDEDAPINDGPVYYSISALGDNGFESAVNSAYHATIFTSAVDASCETELHLQWTPYVGNVANLSEYRIFNGFNLVGTVTGDQESYTYVLEPEDTGEVCLTVTASVNGVGTVNSNATCFVTCQQNTAIAHLDIINFTVFPMPFANELNVAINGLDQPITMNIMDINGRRIHSEQVASTATIASGSWTTGIYFYQLLDSRTGELIQSGKMMKK